MFFLPVHCDLPVQLVGEGNPGDWAIIVVGVNITEGHHTTLLRVTTAESEKVPMNLLKIFHHLGCCKSLYRKSYSTAYLKYLLPYIGILQNYGVLTGSGTRRRGPG